LKQLEKNYRRIVIKIGSSLFGKATALGNIIDQIADLLKQKFEIVVVSSGAIAQGMSILGIENRPKELSHLQAVAALGQNELMNIYREGLANRGLKCGQVLLTWEDFDDRKRYLNAKNTITRLVQLGIVPIINENDTVSVDEIKFGDNDRLSALVSSLISADILIILSDVDGLLDRNKTVISLVNEITPQIRKLAYPTDKKVCVGGMVTKIEAAKIAVESGIPCVIANGRKNDIILSIIKEPEKHGTLFRSQKSLTERDRWIAFGAKIKGRIYVDAGAKEALVNGSKSLLSVGVTKVEGNFKLGDTVGVIDDKDSEFARGKVNFPADELKEIKGRRAKKEVIHRDNLVITWKAR
jgi:glutamate 5-kinase